MKVELTLERIEEMVLCIVHNQLDEDEAVEYAKRMAIECHAEDAVDSGRELIGVTYEG